MYFDFRKNDVLFYLYSKFTLYYLNIISLGKDMRQIFNKLALNTAKLLTAAALALSVSFGALAQAERTPDLSFIPDSFEVAEYKGKKGCIGEDPELETTFAVMRKEGLFMAGGHPKIMTANTGPHTMNFIYQPEKKYGYTVSVKKDRTSERKDGTVMCVYNKISNVRFADELNNIFTTTSIKSPVTAQDCTFDIRMLDKCGSYEAITARLVKAGYQYNWQGDLDQGYKMTLMSDKNQSVYLKTDMQTGATIFTGLGQGTYKAFEVKNLN
jgi:hypothetical protein